MQFHFSRTNLSPTERVLPMFRPLTTCGDGKTEKGEVDDRSPEMLSFALIMSTSNRGGSHEFNS